MKIFKEKSKRFKIMQFLQNCMKQRFIYYEKNKLEMEKYINFGVNLYKVLDYLHLYTFFLFRSTKLDKGGFV